MTITVAIVDGLTTALLALTPVQRWQAARRFNSSYIAQHWFVLIAAVALAVLLFMLFWVSYNRRLEERRITNRLFVESADRRGLSPHERQILLQIADRTGVRQSNSIFTMEDAFDRGATELIGQGLITHTAEQTEQLRAELSFLREKLGFRPPTSVVSPARSKKASSRQIPVGKKLDITRRRTRGSTHIQCTVVKNDDISLAVQLATPVESKPREYWRVRYYFGASVWEFDTSVVGCDHDILVLNHSDNVRFINRRRFLRVSVNMPAWVAQFPFTKVPLPKTANRKGRKTQPRALASGRSAKAAEMSWAAPEFVPGVVTELAGPGLRLEAPLQAEVGDRVLVVFKLDEEKGRASGRGKAGKAAPSKFVEDVGIVRHSKQGKGGFSIAVELVGLNDTDVSELIRATNAASAKEGDKGQDDSAPAASGREMEEVAEELVAAERG